MSRLEVRRRNCDYIGISHWVIGQGLGRGYDWPSTMKVLIRDEESELYWGHHGQWAEYVQDAKDLAFTAYARAVAQGLRLRRFQVLFYFPESDDRIVVSGTDAAGIAR